MWCPHGKLYVGSKGMKIFQIGKYANRNFANRLSAGSSSRSTNIPNYSLNLPPHYQSFDQLI